MKKRDNGYTHQSLKEMAHSVELYMVPSTCLWAENLNRKRKKETPNGDAVRAEPTKPGYRVGLQCKQGIPIHGNFWVWLYS